MTRQELMDAIDNVFEEYADNPHNTLEHLRSEIRIAVTRYCDDLVLDLQEIKKIADRVYDQ